MRLFSARFSHIVRIDNAYLREGDDRYRQCSGATKAHAATMVWGQVVAISEKLASPLVGLVRNRWKRRKLAKKLHTDLYRLIRDRPETHGHPPPFYRETADDLDQAIELELFSDHELEYLAGRLAAYCRAEAQDRSITTVTIDKTYLTWTRLMETDELHPIDVSEIERRLRAELEDTYGRRRFEHPVSEEAREFFSADQ